MSNRQEEFIAEVKETLHWLEQNFDSELTANISNEYKKGKISAFRGELEIKNEDQDANMPLTSEYLEGFNEGLRTLQDLADKYGV